MFSNRDQLEAHQRACAAALSAQRVKYAVAPGRCLSVARGRLNAGDEVLLTDLVDPKSGTSPLVTMQRHVNDGTVLEATEEQLRAANCPADARFVVGRKALMTRRAILTPGEQILPSDVPDGETQLMLLATKGYVIDRAEMAVTA